MPKRQTVEVPLDALRDLLDNAELGFAGMENDVVNRAIATLRPLTGSVSIWSDDWAPTSSRGASKH